MHSALYYPHTQTKDESLLKASLFLWDSLEFIVPYDGYMFRGNNREVAEALEVIGKPLLPSEQDKKAAHEEVVDIVTSNIPERLALHLEDDDSRYLIYPEKFDYETWHVLKQFNLAEQYHHFGEYQDYVLSQGFGLYLMSVLAVVCAGGRKRLVTDKVDAYTALYKSISDEEPDTQKTSDGTRLITVKFKGFDFEHFTLRQLVDLRKRETDLLRGLRQNYFDKFDRCSREISENAQNERVVNEMIKDFTEDMERDMAELKRALRVTATQVLLSKEFGTAVLALAFQALEPVSASLLSAGALTKSLLDYRDKRRSLLKNHASAWLYAATNRFALY